MKKLVPVLLTAAALLLLGGCSAAVAPVNGGQLSESSGALVIPEYAPVSVTLPNGEPVALSDADSRELLALVSSAEDTGDHLVADAYMASASIGGDPDVECLFFESSDGRLLISLPGGELRVTDSADFYRIISGSAFESQYVAEAPVSLVCGEADYTDGVSLSGELLKQKPDGSSQRTRLSAEGVEHPVVIDSVASRFALNFTVSPTEAVATVQDENGNAVFEGTLEKLQSYLPTRNGVYDVSVTAAWKDGGRTGFDGSCTYRFRVSYDLPCTVQAAQTSVVQGQPILVYIRNADADELEVSATGIKYDPYYLEKDDLRVLIFPTHYNTPAGTGSIDITTGDGTVSIPFTIQKYVFKEQRLTISEELSESTVNNDVANYVYTITVQAINDEVDEGRIYFTEPFLQPVEGEITTEFGMKRYVNGEAQSTHAGIDIAAEEGTPVPASNAGRIVFADELQLTGNTVVIEHGSGLKTWYYHMSEITVSEGQMVERGQEIGKVGSTGFSTGPHLHFAATVDGVYISPWYLFGTLPFDSSYRDNLVEWPVEEEESSESSDSSDSSDSSESSDSSDSSDSSSSSESSGS